MASLHVNLLLWRVFTRDACVHAVTIWLKAAPMVCSCGMQSLSATTLHGKCPVSPGLGAMALEAQNTQNMDAS